MTFTRSDPGSRKTRSPAARRFSLSDGSRKATISRGGASYVQPLKDKFEAFWNFSEASGTRNPALGSGSFAEVNGTVGSAVGVGSSQVAANGFIAAPYLTTPNSDVLRPGVRNWTMVFWAYPNDLASPRYPIRKGIATSSLTGGWDILFLATGEARFRTRDVDNSGFTEVQTSTGAITAAGWNLIEMGYSEDSGIFVGVNGAEPVFEPASGVRDTTASVTCLQNSGGSIRWAGRVMTIGVATSLLTASDRSRLYNGGASALLYGDL